jgi:hypothetical protein
LGKRSLLIILFLILIHASLIAVAGEDNFTVEILPGFNGLYTINSWMPITVLIETNLTSFSGQITLKIPYGDLYSSKHSWYSVTKDLFLIEGQQKALQFTLPVLRSGMLETDISKNGKSVFKKTTELKTLNSGARQILIPGNSTDFDFLRQYSGNNGIKYQTNYIHPDLLPMSSKGYSLIDSVVLHGSRLSTLSEDRTEALLAWVRRGGDVFITGSVEHSGDLPVLISNLMPVNIIGPTFADLSDSEWFSDMEPDIIHSLPISRVRAVDSSDIVLEVDGNPIIVHSRQGYGNIYFISLDPGGKNFKNWKNRDIFWDYVFSLGNNERGFIPVKNPVLGLNDIFISEQFAEKILNKSNLLFVFIPLLCFYILISLKIVRGKVFAIFIIFYPIIWTVIIIFFFKVQGPEYFETAIISSRLNNVHGQLYTQGTFAVREAGIYNLKFLTNPDLLLPGNNQSIDIDYSGEKLKLKYLMNSWEKRDFFTENNYVSLSAGSASIRESDILIELVDPMISTFKTPVILYMNEFTDDFILLNEKDKLFISFKTNSVKNRTEQVYKNYPDYYLNFISFIKKNRFLSTVANSDSIFLIFEIQNFPYLLITDPDSAENKAFLILEIPDKDILYEE